MGKSYEPWQAKRIQEAIFPAINYAGILKHRVEQVGFVHGGATIPCRHLGVNQFHQLFPVQVLVLRQVEPIR